MNKEVGNLPSSTWQKKESHIHIDAYITILPARPLLPSLEFLQVLRSVCHVFWAEVPYVSPLLWLSVRPPLLLWLFYRHSLCDVALQGMALCECHCGFQDAHSCAHHHLHHQGRPGSASFITQCLAQHHLQQAHEKESFQLFRSSAASLLYTTEIKEKRHFKKTSNTFQTRNDPNPYL